MASEAIPIPAAPASRPGTPSWVDVVNGWFERLPGPTWAGYAVASAIAIVASAASAITGAEAAVFGVVYYSALPFAILGLIHGLDRIAGQALATVRPLLQMDEDELAAARHRLTVIPARPAWLLTVVGSLVAALTFVLDPVGSAIVGFSPLQLGLRWAWESLVGALFLILVYHTVRQLRLIARVHERLGAIDLFAQARLYALSRLTSRTAAGLILLLIPSLFLIPTGADVSYVLITVAWYGAAMAIALAAFLLPLRGVHVRLVAEKQRLQAETGRRLTATLASLHVATDAGDAAAVEARARTLAALVSARDVVNRAPTWPWSTGALTGFVSAIALPIALFLIQRLLSQVV